MPRLTTYHSFAPYPGSKERDVRFVYCAFVLCSLFGSFASIDLDKAVDYLLRCRVSIAFRSCDLRC